MLRSIKFLFNSGFIKSMNQVASGTLVAQITMVFSAPLLTAIFPPSSFGAFAMVVAAANILVTFASLRVDVLVPFARTQSDLADFVQIAVLGPLMAAIVCTVMFVMLPPSVRAMFGPISLGDSLVGLIPVVASGIACMAAMRSLAVRQGMFALIGKAQIIRVLALVFASYSLGVLGWTGVGAGLSVGQALGDLLFALLIWHNISPRCKLRLLTVRPARIWASIQSEARAIKLLSSTQAIAILYERGPPLVILIAFGPTEVGYYVLAAQIAQAPTVLLASAFDDVFRQRASKLLSRGESLTAMMRDGLTFTLAVSVLPLSAVILLVPKFVEPVFGSNWVGATQTIIITMSVSIFAFNSSAFDKVPIMLQAHKFIFNWHLARFLLEFVAGVIAIDGVIDYPTWLLITAIGRAILYAVKLNASFVLASAYPLVVDRRDAKLRTGSSI